MLTGVMELRQGGQGGKKWPTTSQERDRDPMKSRLEKLLVMATMRGPGGTWMEPFIQRGGQTWLQQGHGLRASAWLWGGEHEGSS